MMDCAPPSSDYFQGLDGTAKLRYKEKLEKLGAIEDPYLRWGHSTLKAEEWQNWPKVEYPDIYNFLIQSPSLYTGESLKAYKSLDAYNYYMNGWIDKATVCKLPNCPNTYLATGCVKHSQSLSATPAKPWVAVKTEGTVVVAHCTCMAGLGEACSHIAALLFLLEGNTLYQNNLSCTSLPCSWLPPSFHSVPFAQLADIDFSTPQAKRRKVHGSSTNNVVKADATKVPTTQELDSLYKQISGAGKPVILSLIPGYSEPYIPLYSKGALPNPLTSFFDVKNLELSYHDLLNKCDEFFNAYTITPTLAKAVEEKTKDQARSKIWFHQRSGRVTASKFRSALCTDVTHPSQSLIKAICYPESTSSFKSKATRWGCEHEEQARMEYENRMCKKHVNFTMSKSGLIISPSYPLMGASPDGIIKCRCCGYGVLEIKCPYSCYEKTIRERIDESRFFLQEKNGEILLDVYHAYYLQVQVQIKFSDAQYCDFVVWSADNLFVQRLYLDEPFISIALEKCKEFIKFGILPEILGKWYSREHMSLTKTADTNLVKIKSDHDENDSREQDIWCYCRKEESGTMIACDNQACPIQWFHAVCLHLKKIPKGKWLCPECNRKNVKKSSVKKLNK